MISGFLLIDKPSGPTSHDVIDDLRKLTGIKKIGHSGTLDPFASGLLIVGVGRAATRRLEKFLKLDKEYMAELKLGAVSDTYDRTGNIKASKQDSKQAINIETVEKIVEKFKGEVEQIPPMYSAKKVKGRKLYELARQGEEIERQPIKVKIDNLEIIEFSWPVLKIKCAVSSGTYIRSLAHDIGQQLRVGAYLQELQRTAIGEYNLADAIQLDRLTRQNWTGYLRDLP